MRFTVTTRFTEPLRDAFSKMRQLDIDRHLARKNLLKRIADNRKNTKQPPLSEGMLRAELNTQLDKDWVTKIAEIDYATARTETGILAQLETTELLRRMVEQNEQLIRLLDERLPHKIV